MLYNLAVSHISILNFAHLVQVQGYIMIRLLVYYQVDGAYKARQHSATDSHDRDTKRLPIELLVASALSLHEGSR